MFKETLRVFAIFLMIIIIIMDDFPFYNKLRNQSTQLFLAIFVIGTIYYDTVLGFILALVLMLIYYEIYKKLKRVNGINDTSGTSSMNNGNASMSKNIEHYMEEPESVKINKEIGYQPTFVGPSGPIESTKSCKNGITQLNYISEEHLLAAQNNVFNSENFSTEVKGIEKGFNNEHVYGAQGLDSDKVNVHGYDNNDKFTSLSK